MKFAEVIEGLKKGHLFAREKWYNGICEQNYIVAHIPQKLSPEIVRKMTSLPLDAIDAVVGHGSNGDHGWLTFHDQVLIIRSSVLGSFATSYTPSWEDIFAEDWYFMDK